jgi:fimbrial chaperone protein
MFHSLLISCILLPSLLLASAAAPPTANADWRVIPIRLDFNQQNRSGVITLQNDGSKAVAFTMEAVAWTQDPSGQDRYAATEDLVFFPKQITIPPGQERVIRAGIRTPAGASEKTYRLFIKEVPEARKAEGAAVAIAIQFGVPIFVKPAREDLKGELSASLSKDGRAEVSVTNTGNVHFRIKSVVLAGKTTDGIELHRQESNGWYLLADTSRGHFASIPAEICPQLQTLDIQVNSDRITLTGTIDVDPSACPIP